MRDPSVGPAGAKAPKVTVLMAVYNGERFLREAIESILEQAFTDFEFVILNDGSSDSSRNVVLSFNDSRIILVDNPENLGLAKSLNLGLSLARGKYVARMDADDRSHISRLQKQVAFLDANPRIAVIGSRLRLIDARGNNLPDPVVRRAVDPLAFRWYWMFDNPLAHSSVMFRLDVVWGQFRGYNEEFRTSQDCELWSRVGRDHEMANLSDILVDFRVHDGSASKHYKPVDIMKLATVYEFNIGRLLQTEAFSGVFSLCWLQVTMPGLERIDNGVHLLDMFYAIREKFFCMYPAASINPEIRDHCVFVLIRCARYFATTDRITSLRFVCEILRCKRLPVRELGVYAALLFLGERVVQKIRNLTQNHSKRKCAGAAKRL